MKYCAVLLSLIISASLHAMFSVEEFEKKKTGKEAAAYINQFSNLSGISAADVAKIFKKTTGFPKFNDFLDFLRELKSNHPITQLMLGYGTSLADYSTFLLGDEDISDNQLLEMIKEFARIGFKMSAGDYRAYFLENLDRFEKFLKENKGLAPQILNAKDIVGNNLGHLFVELKDGPGGISKAGLKKILPVMVDTGLDLTDKNTRKQTPLDLYKATIKDADRDPEIITLLTPKSQAKPQRFDLIDFTKIDDGKRAAEYVLTHDLESLSNQDRDKLFQLIDALWPIEYYEFLKKLPANHTLTKITSSPLNRNTTLSHTATSFLSSMLAQTQLRLNILQALIEKGLR